MTTPQGETTTPRRQQKAKDDGGMQVNTGWGVDVQVDGRRGKANTEADEGGVCSSQDPEQWVVGMGGACCVSYLG